MGRPKREITNEQIAEIETMALNNCHMDTIALALSIPKETLVRRFGMIIKQKRAEGRVRLRAAQIKAVEAGVPSLLIFLGKNELDQKDSKDINLGGNVSITLEREKKTHED